MKTHIHEKRFSIFYSFAEKCFLSRIRNVSCATNQHIRMISEGSCDTEDWSNDAENSALHPRNNLHLFFKMIKNTSV